MGADIRHKDPLKGVIKDPQDTRLEYLLEFGDMWREVIELNNYQRYSDEHSSYLSWHGRSLLATAHEYACLSQFTTDFLEKGIFQIKGAHILYQCSKFLKNCISNNHPYYCQGT